MVLICSGIFWVILFAMFFEGFDFLGRFLPATNEVVERLFGVFFLSMLLMLVFSTGIILYTSLFASRESTYLLTLPASEDRVFAYKFAEALAIASWGFLLLGSPMMVAYGINVGADWPYYAMFLGFLVAFVLIAGSLGAVAAVLVANYLPRRPKTFLALTVALLAALAVLMGLRLIRTPGEALTREWLDALLDRLNFSQHPLYPSRWVARGLVGAARGEFETGGFYLAVTVAHAGLAYIAAAVVARDLYRRGYSQAQGGRSTRRRLGLYGLDAAFHRLFGFIPRPVRLLILKDLRTFRRDPAQWSQFLIFFGLLAFYFLNIRRFGYSVQSAYWRHLLSFLNLAVTALLLSTFTTRFIFPLLSLEGRNLWVLGLLPLRRDAILWGKFAFAAGISLVATEALVLLSDLMLGVEPWMVALHVGAVLVLCLGVSGISVGLGARLPNLREEDPSKIAAGFGGTLNLLVSLVFIACIVVSLAMPTLAYFRISEGNGAAAFYPNVAGEFRIKMAIAVAFCLALGAAATLVPLRLGIRAFQRMEF
jgi:ABC-2 type transport system permease protein